VRACELSSSDISVVRLRGSLFLKGGTNDSV
jgi:hypothetical protein